MGRFDIFRCSRITAARFEAAAGGVSVRGRPAHERVGRADIGDADGAFYFGGFGGLPETASIGAQNRWLKKMIYDSVTDLPPDVRVVFVVIIEE